MLRDTGDAIEATFPISGMAGSGGAYDRWWSRGITYGDDPDRVNYSYSPPSVMLLHDSSGSVVLIGCRATGWERMLNAGKGIIVADFAVLGGKSLDYDQINGMRTTSPAYRHWMGASSISINRDADHLDRLQSLTLSLKRVEDFQVSQKFGLSARLDWKVMPVLGGVRRARDADLRKRWSRILGRGPLTLISTSPSWTSSPLLRGRIAHSGRFTLIGGTIRRRLLAGMS